MYFNPRSPRGGATRRCWRFGQKHDVFQSTLPTRGSDKFGWHIQILSGTISIHAPHEGERLLWDSASPPLTRDFNPRSPRGGATRRTLLCFFKVSHISIHAPHEGERRYTAWRFDGANGISIHAPHEGERRQAVIKLAKMLTISIHAPHEGERLAA